MAICLRGGWRSACKGDGICLQGEWQSACKGEGGAGRANSHCPQGVSRPYAAGLRARAVHGRRRASKSGGVRSSCVQAGQPRSSTRAGLRSRRVLAWGRGTGLRSTSAESSLCPQRLMFLRAHSVLLQHLLLSAWCSAPASALCKRGVMTDVCGAQQWGCCAARHVLTSARSLSCVRRCCNRPCCNRFCNLCGSHILGGVRAGASPTVPSRW